jgi:hypothetical protein
MENKNNAGQRLAPTLELATPDPETGVTPFQRLMEMVCEANRLPPPENVKVQSGLWCKEEGGQIYGEALSGHWEISLTYDFIPGHNRGFKFEVDQERIHPLDQYLLFKKIEEMGIQP